MAGVPVFLVTASTQGEHVERALQAGAADYLVKPIDPRILRARVASALVDVEARRAEETIAVAPGPDPRSGELDQARQVQRAQLPVMPLHWKGWGATGAIIPCGAVGGDLFDVSDGRDGRRIAVLMDVCGHGVGAALVAASLRVELRALFRSSPLQEGMFPGERYERCTLRVRRGDRVAMMSDGVTEPFGDAIEAEAAAEGLGLFDASKWREGDSLSAGERMQRWTDAAPRGVRDDAALLLLEAGA